MDNYVIARDRAREYFLGYDLRKLMRKPGVRSEGTELCFRFLGTETRVSRETGVVTCAYPGFDGWEADFSEALSVYDWLCDAKPDAAPADEYCPVNSLPGVYVGGSGGLMMDGGVLPTRIDQDPDAFKAACEKLGGTAYPAGDMGFRLNLFPDLAVILKFYFSDDEFPAQLTVLWDKNTLDFVRYETVYYIAGVLFRRIRENMESFRILAFGLDIIQN